MSMASDAIPPGTLHLLILKTLARSEEMHGFEIAEAIERGSADVFVVEEGSLYPAQFERITGAIVRILQTT